MRLPPASWFPYSCWPALCCCRRCCPAARHPSSRQAARGTAGLQLSVVEGFTETPIEGAAVIIIETGEIYYTDETGNTDVIQVPFIRDTRYDDILSKPWGEVSLIVYKDGYVPYALFYLQVLENETRQGVKILLFSDDQTQSDEPFAIIEGPNRLWVDALIKMYRPTEN